MRYHVSSHFGRRCVSEDEARRVRDTWTDPAHGQYVEEHPDGGFTAWTDSELGGRLMGTRYTPVAE